MCCVLYHLSMDDKVKSMFTYTECIPVVMRLILETTEEQVCQCSGGTKVAQMSPANLVYPAVFVAFINKEIASA